MSPDAALSHLNHNEEQFEKELAYWWPTELDDTVEALSHWYRYGTECNEDDDSDDSATLDEHDPLGRTLQAIARDLLSQGEYDDDEEDPDTPQHERLPPVSTVKSEKPRVGRNDPCPCGSGKKYKQCCWSPDE